MNELKKPLKSEPLKQQAIELKLYGLQLHWQELTQEQLPWLEKILRWELAERQQRSLEHRLNNAKLGRF